MSRDHLTAEAFIKAIPGSGGIITTIAKRVGCHWSTAKIYIDNHPTVAEAYKTETEAVSDMAQGTLMKSIQEGNTQDAKWWLARKRRSEFGDNLDVTSKGEKIDVTRLTDEQLELLIQNKRIDDTNSG